ncbi:MAG TPA: LysE family transporter [Chitinophagales bacterium]|nr:LysE family transporter [Chitinophagales bacterium]
MLYLFAFVLGFVGYLPPGNINLTVVQLRVSQHRTSWWWFILFAAAMEFVYCFGCMWGIQLLLKQQQLSQILNWSAVVIFLALGLFSLLHTTTDNNNTSVEIKRGILVAIVNPLQIPFWMVWGVYAMKDGWLGNDALSIALFSIACSVGTIAVLTLYAEVGRKLVEKLNLNKLLLNRIIGVLFISLAVYQTIKTLTA